MTPSLLTLRLTAVWALAALACAVLRHWQPGLGQALSMGWMLCSAVLLVALLVDFRSSSRQLIKARRVLPESFSLGTRQSVAIEFENTGERPLALSVYDHHPESYRVEQQFPVALNLDAARHYRFEYNGAFWARGLAHFGALDVRYPSRFRLWQIHQRIDVQQDVKVFPDFMSIAYLDALHDDEQQLMLGLNRVQRRGEGLSFRQLREYRDGDNIRHIDWKASSRQQKLITREFEDERDQQVLYLLDCGRRMRSKDGDLSHFDHALNAMLISASVVLKHGDAVGMMGFATPQQRYFPPAKGHMQLNALLNYTYDIQCSQQAADYLSVVTDLGSRQKRRSLVILITNLQEESTDDLLASVNYLKRNHQVMVACLQETVVNDNLEADVKHAMDAFLYLGSVAYQQRRAAMVQALHESGVIVIDTQPAELHQGLVRQYLALKKQGVF